MTHQIPLRPLFQQACFQPVEKPKMEEHSLLESKKWVK